MPSGSPTGTISSDDVVTPPLFYFPRARDCVHLSLHLRCCTPNGKTFKGISMEIALSDTGLPILYQFSEEGFIDCVFKIINLQDQGASYRFDLRAFYQGAELGFAAEVIKGMQGGFDENVHLIKNHV